jgi:hypothetical protein
MFLAGAKLDGFEFLTMAEAGEVGHWEILGTLNERARNSNVPSSWVGRCRFSNSTSRRCVRLRSSSPPKRIRTNLPSETTAIGSPRCTAGIGAARRPETRA